MVWILLLSIINNSLHRGFLLSAQTEQKTFWDVLCNDDRQCCVAYKWRHRHDFTCQDVNWLNAHPPAQSCAQHDKRHTSGFLFSFHFRDVTGCIPAVTTCAAVRPGGCTTPGKKLQICNIVIYQHFISYKITVCLPTNVKHFIEKHIFTVHIKEIETWHRMAATGRT